MMNPATVKLTEQAACAAGDVLCLLDRHEGTAAYLQAVLSVGVAVVTATWAIVQGQQRRADAKRRWHAHLASIVALVDLADSEVRRLQKLMDGGFCLDDLNEAPETRYFEPVLGLIKTFSTVGLPNEEAVRAWLDLKWELGLFRTSIRDAWDKHRSRNTLFVNTGLSPEDRVNVATARVNKAAERIRQACAAAQTRDPPQAIIAHVPALIEAG